MRRDHREAVAEHDEHRALDAGQLGRQHHVLGHLDPQFLDLLDCPLSREDYEKLLRQTGKL